MEKTKTIGNFGETLAEEYLKKLGYKILDRNWKYSNKGEIDIVAKDKLILVFVEVKYRRTNNFGSALEAFSRSKYEKVRNSGFAYMEQSKENFGGFRIDLIAIDKDENRNKINHYKNLAL